MDKEIEIKKKLIMEIISSIIEKDLEDFSKTSKDYLPEWDSLNHAQIIFSIEDQFDIELTQQQMIDICSANDILEIISNEK
tara:strand:- start:371 stop:613 length:243 start_codon:yes stop_codon:yes gene_type:complete